MYYTYYLIFRKKLCFDLMTWGGMLSEARTINTLFQFNVSVNVFKVEIYI